MRAVLDTNVMVSALLLRASVPGRAFVRVRQRGTEPVRACRDPADDRILELAVNGRAGFIVTGDADLLYLNPFRGTRILAPAAFLHAVE